MTAFALTSFSTLEMWLIGGVLVLIFLIWRITRHHECGYLGEPDGEISALLPAVAGLCHGTVTAGNSVEMILGADFFGAVVRDIRESRHSVHMETFLWEDGKAGDLIADALCAAASRGVKVRVTTDARGASGLSSETSKKLKSAGCEHHRFHRWRPMNIGRFNIRTHRKILVIDGATAYVGGHCIADSWLEDQEKHPVYHDLSIRLKGPVVNQIQSVFSENWVESECGLFVDSECFPEPKGDGPAKAHVAYVRPDGCPSSVQILYHLVIGLAKKSILIQNPYFLPDPAGARALAKAAERGVDVRIMTPAVKATDSFFVTYAGHSHYGKLLKSGVRIFEYQPTLLHQKTITVDSAWCGIGSANFDDRSFEINDEIVVGIQDKSTVADLERIFEAHMGDCKEITTDEWERRPLAAKLRERFFHLFNEQF